MLFKANSFTCKLLNHFFSEMGFSQGALNRREIQLTRPAPPYDYTCFADGTPFGYEIFRKGYCIRGNCTSDKYVLYKWSTFCKSCIIMVGWAPSVVCPFYFILLGFSILQKFCVSFSLN